MSASPIPRPRTHAEQLQPTHGILPRGDLLLVGNQQLFQVIGGADLPQLILDAPDQLCLLLLTKSSSLEGNRLQVAKSTPQTAVCAQGFSKSALSQTQIVRLRALRTSNFTKKESHTFYQAPKTDP